MANRICVFIAMSLDGFIAGPNDELDWLDVSTPEVDTFTPFFEGVGAMLMGRRTYDVVAGMDVDWPYGETPVCVATHRELKTEQPTVRAISGDINSLVEQAREAAGEGDVYLDGGALIRSALDAALVDEMIITVAPIILGAGLPLFAGAERRHTLELVSQRPLGGGFVELVYRPSDW